MKVSQACKTHLSLVSGNQFIIVYTFWKTLVNSLAGVARVEPPSRASEQAQITMQITTQMLHDYYYYYYYYYFYDDDAWQFTF